MRSRIRNAVSDTIFLLRSVPSPVVTVFTLSVVLMNILANKTIYQHGILAVDGGFVLSWAVFLCMDIITKHFGPRAATKISVCALIVNLFVSGIFALVAAIPTEADFSAFNTVIGGVWFILFSSSAAFIVSAFVNNGMNYAIGRLFSKDPDGRAAYFTRSYVSTFVGQFVDNFIFAGLTFMVFAPIYWDGFCWTMTQCVTCSMIGALMELLMEVVFSPIGYAVTRRWRESVW